MRAKTVRLAGVTGADAERWLRLADRAVEPNACLDARFLLPARDFDGIAAAVALRVVGDGGKRNAVVAPTRPPVWRSFSVMGLTTRAGS